MFVNFIVKIAVLFLLLPENKYLDRQIEKEGKNMVTRRIVRTRYYHSPCGILVLGSFEEKLCLCDWEVEKHRESVTRRLQRVLQAGIEEAPSDVTQEAARQLDEYFRRERTAFEIPLLFAGTDFQKRVWNGLLEIPYGQTVSYGEMAKRLCLPKSVRAVANANGANAISIFAPCHRVIGSDRSLTGYGGGLPAKKFLLELEQVFPEDGLFASHL